MNLAIIIRVFAILFILFALIYFLIPNKPNKSINLKSDEELTTLEEESVDLITKKQKIKEVTNKKQKQINNINKNLEK